MRTVFSTLSRLIDSLNDKVGNLVSWLCFSMVIVTFGVVVARYAFNEGSIMVQETVIYMYAFVFMLGAGYTYLNEGHVRVDIFFKNRFNILMSSRQTGKCTHFNTIIYIENNNQRYYKFVRWRK